jgi:flagellar hook-associated protein 2
MTLTLTGVGNTTVAVNNDPSQVTTAVQTFVTDYNSVISNINTATAFDASDPTQNGVLFGNSTVQQVQSALSSFITQTYNNLGTFHSLADVGITVNQDGTLALSTTQLSQALATDPTDVQKLFTTNVPAVPADLTKTPPVIGSPAVHGIGITLSNLLDTWTNGQTGQLFDASDAMQTQITQLTANQTAQTNLLNQKKNVLVEEFANLEVSIACFQSQGSALSSIQTTLGTSSSSK